MLLQIEVFVKRFLRLFVDLNVRLSLLIDSVLPLALRRDGNSFFKMEMLPEALRSDLTIYDLGGGSNPYLSADFKQELNAVVVGLDISADELGKAPLGCYDRTIACDLSQFQGEQDADLVICQATLEHVTDTSGCLRAIAEAMAPDGRAYLFAPSRNAVFARLNLLLPEGLKRQLLFTLFPHKALGHDGFEAHYDKCKPSQIEALAVSNGLEIERRELFWISSYFRFFVPLFLLWRCWQCISWAFLGDDAAETFAYVLRKPGNA